MNTGHRPGARTAGRSGAVRHSPTIERVDASVAAALAGVTGLCLGALAMAARPRRGARSGPAPSTPPASPAAPAELSAADVLTLLPGAAILVARDDAVVGSSQQAQALGLVRGDRIGSAAVLDLVHGVQRDGAVREAELEIPRGPLGSGVTAVGVRVAPLGSVLVLVTVVDLSESRRVDAVRRDFVANVSHELKTPVGALSLLAEAVQDAADDPEAVRRFAGRMQREAARLTRLVQDLIDLSRLQGADPLAEAEPVRAGRGGRRGGGPLPDSRRWPSRSSSVRGGPPGWLCAGRSPAGHRGAQPGRQRRDLQPGADPGRGAALQCRATASSRSP